MSRDFNADPLANDVELTETVIVHLWAWAAPWAREVVEIRGAVVVPVPRDLDLRCPRRDRPEPHAEFRRANIEWGPSFRVMFQGIVCEVVLR